VKVGITLPTFEPTAAAALATARAAEGAGIDGVFVFDHLWRGARRSRPCPVDVPGCWPLSRQGLGAFRLGSLVARVGFLPDRLIAESFFSLAGAVRASSGGGPSASGTRRAFRRTRHTGSSGLRWRIDGRRWPPSSASSLLAGSSVGWEATAPATLEVARAAGATVNLWDVDLDRLEAEVARGPATWRARFRPRRAPRLTS